MKLKKLLIVTIIIISCSVNIMGCGSSSTTFGEKENKPIKQSQEKEKPQGKIDDGERMLELLKQYPNIYDKSSQYLTSEELKAREEVVDILVKNPDYLQYIRK